MVLRRSPTFGLFVILGLGCGSTQKEEDRAGSSAASACADMTCTGGGCGGAATNCPPRNFCAQGEILCPRAVFFGRAVDGGPTTYEANATDSDNARCAITALRDGKVGRVEITLDRNTLGETGDQTSYAVHVREGRLASFEKKGLIGPENGFMGFANAPLKPPTFFADCLATNDDGAFVECLTQAVDPCP